MMKDMNSVMSFRSPAMATLLGRDISPNMVMFAEVIARLK
jgi:hypothetical protein